jgi:transporter family protein
MWTQNWLFYALLAAIAAAAANICGRVGMQDVDSTLATAIRSIVMMIFVVSIAAVGKSWRHMASFKRLDIVMVVLSGVFGATSWLMGFKALSLSEGKVFRVSSIDKLSVPLAAVLAFALLGERPTPLNWLGVVMIVGGAFLVAMPK